MTLWEELVTSIERILREHRPEFSDEQLNDIADAAAQDIIETVAWK